MNGLGALQYLPLLCLKQASMRIATLPFAFALATSALAQTPPFERLYTIPGALNILGATRDDDGNYYIANETPDDDIQVTRINANGEHVWTKAYPFFTEDGLYGNSIAIGPEGIIVGGYTIGAVTNSRDGIILRISPDDGSLLASTRIDAFGSSNAIHYLKRINGGFIATGRGEGGAGMYDMLLAKLDDSGTMLWSKTYGSPGWDWAYEATQLADGGFALVGYGDSLVAGHSPTGYIVRTDALGNEMWARSFSSGASVDETYTVVEGTNGDLYVGGRSLGFILAGVTAYITKISSTGSHVWTRILANGIEVGQLLPTANGGVAWLAHPQNIPGGGGDYDMAWGAFDAGGTLTGTHVHGATGSDNAITFFQNPDGGYSIIGFTNIVPSNNWQGMLIVTGPDGEGNCDNINLPLNWTSATAVLAPFTSVTGSGFSEFPYPIGTADVAVGTSNPCCNENAAFTAQQQSDPFTWQFVDGSTGAGTYAWDFGDGQTSTEPSPLHTFGSNGSYNVCLTITGECGSSTFCQQINLSVGINDVGSGNAGITLNPSPANAFFTVRSEHALITSVQLVDANGRLLQTMAYNRNGSVVVPVAQLPNGLYVARIHLANGTMQHLRVMVAH
jgi:PKD repeat protein